MGEIIGRSVTALNFARTVRAVRRHERVCLGDENSRGKVQNVRGGSSDFFHGQLREAVVRRYGPTKPVDYHKDVATYLATRWRNADRHAISELPFHQTRGEMWEEVEATICDLEFINAKVAAGMTYELVADYSAALGAISDGRYAREPTAEPTTWQHFLQVLHRSECIPSG
jgi:hypothetical protein